MNCFLIDFENVHVNGFEGFEDLQRGDSVIVFHSTHAGELPYEILGRLSCMGVHVDMKEVSVGTPNALDFQLSSYLGYVIHSCHSDESEFSFFSEWVLSIESFFIVSNDKGYAAVADFWNERGVNVSLVSNLAMGKPRLRIDDVISRPAQSSDSGFVLKKKKKKEISRVDVSSALLSLNPSQAGVSYAVVSAKKKDIEIPSLAIPKESCYDTCHLEKFVEEKKILATDEIPDDEILEEEEVLSEVKEEEPEEIETLSEMISEPDEQGNPLYDEAIAAFKALELDEDIPLADTKKNKKRSR